MLKACFSDPDCLLPGKFIPIDIRYNNPITFESYINLHNKYLHEHRSITVFNVSTNDLHNNIQSTSSNKNNSLCHAIKNCSVISWITTTKFTNMTGKIVLSTTSHNYMKAMEWVDTVFLPLHHTIVSKNTTTQFLGEKSHRSTKPSPSQDDYTMSLTSNVSDITENQYSDPPPHNAWNKPISIITKPSTNNTNSTTQSTISSTNQSNVSTLKSIATMESQIEALTSIVVQLQDEIKSMKTQQNELISTTIDRAINAHSIQIDKKYESLISSITSIITQNTTNTSDHTTKAYNNTLPPPPSITTTSITRVLRSPAMQIDSPLRSTKSNRSDPGSGSNRVRKLSRPSLASLSSLKSQLFEPKLTETNITMQNKTSSTTIPNESDIQHTND